VDTFCSDDVSVMELKCGRSIDEFESFVCSLCCRLTISFNFDLCWSCLEELRQMAWLKIKHDKQLP
jgi:hypothetical protein